MAFSLSTNDTIAIRALRESDATLVITKMRVSRALIEGRAWRDTLTYSIPALLSTIGSQGTPITEEEVQGFNDVEKRLFSARPTGTKMTGFVRKNVDTMKALCEGIPNILASGNLRKYALIIQLDASTRDAATPQPAAVREELNLNSAWAQVNEAVGLAYLLLILRSLLQTQGNLMARHLADAVHVAWDHHVVALQGPPGTGKTTSQGVDVALCFAIENKYQAINASAMNRPLQQMAHTLKHNACEGTPYSTQACRYPARSQEKVDGVDRESWRDARGGSYQIATYAKISRALEIFGDSGVTPYRVTADEAQQGHDPKNQALISLAEAKHAAKEENANMAALQEHQGDHYQSPGGQPDITTQLTALQHELLKGTLLNPNFDFQPVREVLWRAEETILEHQELRQEWVKLVDDCLEITREIARISPDIDREEDK